MHFSDKLSPFQVEGKKYFAGSESEYALKMYQAVCEVSGIRQPTEEYTLAQSDLFTVEEMGSTPIQHHFLQSLIFANRSKNGLEIGSFIGLSSMYLAAALKENGGTLVTIEKFDKFAAVAKENFTKNDFTNIELKVGDAYEIIKNWKGPKLDFVFLDGNKEKYDEYFLLLDPLLQENGLIVVDDVFFNGDVFNEQCQTPKGMGARNLLELVKGRSDYHRSLLPLSNGLLILQKKRKKN